MDRRQLVFGLGLAPLAGLALPGSANASDKPLKLRTLYNKDRSFSDVAAKLEGSRITVDGYMAPPLKADSRFFVLTKIPMAVCPFCETEAEWPRDILAIYTKRTVDVVPFNSKILTRGILELGTYKDPDTGFVSRARLVDSVYERT
ncbi:hypothetical protein [Roseibium aggregatum]|uniref:DUF3299 domain-containing protein n=1 Tax=Roseibium aggregatum TaxID=187304 RepID=A0A939EF24_9HYPH|nr:hypothetical protein [Roseibium aggregatum]MBN9671793.1 hypothetical protein [Roseibium aggregatum]